MTILRRLSALLLLTTVNLAYAGLDVPSGKYGLDKTHAYITFSYSHLGFSTPHVGFNKFDVDMVLDADDLTKSQVSVVIDAASVESRVGEFNEHLRGEDYFNVAKYPEIRFRSTAIEMTGEATANITGELTILGVTKPVVLAATINKAAAHPMLKVPVVGVSATATVKRTDWGLSKAVPFVGDDVNLYLSVELPKE